MFYSSAYLLLSFSSQSAARFPIVLRSFARLCLPRTLPPRYPSPSHVSVLLSFKCVSQSIFFDICIEMKAQLRLCLTLRTRLSRGGSFFSQITPPHRVLMPITGHYCPELQVFWDFIAAWPNTQVFPCFSLKTVQGRVPARPGIIRKATRAQKSCYSKVFEF
jgi:hypothetical protein